MRNQISQGIHACKTLSCLRDTRDRLKEDICAYVERAMELDLDRKFINNNCRVISAYEFEDQLLEHLEHVYRQRRAELTLTATTRKSKSKSKSTK